MVRENTAPKTQRKWLETGCAHLSLPRCLFSITSLSLMTTCSHSRGYSHIVWWGCTAGFAKVPPFIDQILQILWPNTRLKMLSCSWFQSFMSDPVKWDLILDHFSMITRPYTRINGLKTISFPAAHTRRANILEYPRGPHQHKEICRGQSFHHSSSTIIGHHSSQLAPSPHIWLKSHFGVMLPKLSDKTVGRDIVVITFEIITHIFLLLSVG